MEFPFVIPLLVLPFIVPFVELPFVELPLVELPFMELPLVELPVEPVDPVEPLPPVCAHAVAVAAPNSAINDKLIIEDFMAFSSINYAKSIHERFRKIIQERLPYALYMLAANGMPVARATFACIRQAFYEFSWRGAIQLCGKSYINACNACRSLASISSPVRRYLAGIPLRGE
ncbi:MAG TPA: hypothetical protein VFW00_04715 [Rhodocyclaceae bacterium]|nr:hypothetical protein [Rhodocyclaceae bacterium]